MVSHSHTTNSTFDLRGSHLLPSESYCTHSVGCVLDLSPELTGVTLKIKSFISQSHSVDIHARLKPVQLHGGGNNLSSRKMKENRKEGAGLPNTEGGRTMCNCSCTLLKANQNCFVVQLKFLF